MISIEGSLFMVVLCNRADHIYFQFFFIMSFVMAALCNRAGHYIFALWFILSSLFLLSSFFPRLISAVADWMSAILPHMVWP